MRIDKYLWCVRLFKTRSLATLHVNSGKLLIDEIPAKAARTIKVGDTFRLKRHGYEERFEVLGIPKSRIGARLVPDFLIEKTPQTELDKKDFLRLSRNLSRQKGLGRPTKKDRRDLDKLDF